MRVLIVLFAVLALTGCATSKFTHGHDFTEQQVSQIVKGQTTTEQLKAIMGEPFSKTPISATTEKWLYVFTRSESKAQHYLVTMKVNSNTSQKMLDVLIESGVVSNFTYTNRPVSGIQVN